MKSRLSFAFFIGSARPLSGHMRDVRGMGGCDLAVHLKRVVDFSLQNGINSSVLRTYMQKWKYMQSNKDAEWNKFGKSGWEMVTVLQAKDGSHLAFFKKPLN